MKQISTILLTLILNSTLTAQSPCLIASYPFNGNANDVTNNGHDGAVFGATLAEDRFGIANSCYHFDGLNNHIDISGDWSSAGQNGTISAWIFLDDLDDYRPILWHEDNPNVGNALALNISCDNSCEDTSGLWYAFDARECGDHLYANTTYNDLQPGNWTHVAVTTDDLGVHIFINCTEVATYIQDGWNNPGYWFADLCGGSYTTYIGKSGDTYFKGRIDDLRIYDCALNASEIAELCGLEPNDCLIAGYPFDGNALDTTGNGHDGTVNGATLAQDRFGDANSCYQFNGTTDYIDISGTWTGSNGTISAYIYLDDLDDYRPIFQHDDNDHLGNSFDMNIDCATCQDSSRLWYGFDNRECEGDLYFTNSQPKLEPGAWTHVAMSADETTTHLYINCVEVPTYLYGDNPGLWFDDLCAGPFTTLIGKSVSSDGSEFHFKGRIDDIRVYNCALSAEEIATLCDINTATVEQAQSAEITAYPNPTKGLVRLSNVPMNSVPQAFDATGRKIPVAMPQQGSELVIDLSAFPIGLYFIRVAEHSFSIVRQ